MDCPHKNNCAGNCSNCFPDWDLNRSEYKPVEQGKEEK